MKKIFLVLIILLLGLCGHAELLQGSVEYDVNSAREDLLQDVSYSINTQQNYNNIYDADYEENYGYLLSGKTKLNDRTLAYFSDGSYAVQKNENLYVVNYYNKDGKLTHIERKKSLDYPYKSYKYNTNGKLVNMALRISKEETYIYANSGKLLAHWIKNNAYDEQGNIIMTRKYVE